MSNVVSDASPLIYLSKIGKVEIMKALFRVVSIPEKVAEEVTERVPNKRFRAATAWQRIRLRGCIRQGWINVVPASQIHPDAFRGIPENLDAGEKEAIALARSLRATLMVVDENRTINFLENNNFPSLSNDISRYGVRVLNTLGVIHLARKLGVVPSMRDIVKELMVVNQMGFKQAVVLQYLKNLVNGTISMTAGRNLLLSRVRKQPEETKRIGSYSSAVSRTLSQVTRH